jgi:LysR family transcriptional regulator, glycine cleavage system transcriptional activator
LSRPLPHSLNLLRVFEVVARFESIKLAADKLCLTPSAVSQQLKSLESHLGIALFDRQPSSLQLTSIGKQYAIAIRPLLSALDEATANVCARGSSHQVLRVTMLTPMANRIVLPRLKSFRQAHPDIELHLDSTLQYQDLQQRQVDLAFRYGRPPWPGCVHEKLLDLYIQPICSPALVDEYKLREQSTEALKYPPLVHMTERPDAWALYLAHTNVHREIATTDFHVDDYPSAIEAAETIGVSLAVMPLEQPLVKSGRVQVAGPMHGPLPDSVYAVMLPEMQADPRVVGFLAWIRAQLASSEQA